MGIWRSEKRKSEKLKKKKILKEEMNKSWIRMSGKWIRSNNMNRRLINCKEEKKKKWKMSAIFKDKPKIYENTMNFLNLLHDRKYLSWIKEAQSIWVVLTLVHRRSCSPLFIDSAFSLFDDSISNLSTPTARALVNSGSIFQVSYESMNKEKGG